jgi:transcriptional regulator with XRE-family HTH domain
MYTQVVVDASTLANALRAVRVRAGLTQEQVAAALGLSCSSRRAFVHRLEKGRIPNPGFFTVVDFLRACRGSAADIADVLDRALAQPLNVPQRTRPGRPRGPRRTGPSPEELARLKMRREAADSILRQVVEHMLHCELNAVNAPPFHPIRRDACRYGRRVFKILTDTRRGREQRRGLRLARVEASAARRGVPDELTRYIRDGVTELFEDMEREGELDWLPDEERAQAVTLRSARRRLFTDTQMCASELAKRRAAEFAAVQKRAGPIIEAAKLLLEQAGVTGNRVGNYMGFVNGIINVAMASGPGTPQRQQQLERNLATCTRPCQDSALLRRLVELVFQRWDAGG